ncbi:protein of unknown function [Taphrina deformans PYCC 5710]|uniref:Uncharacterized protein n=1 Tax=Taphrina deformans (strain PYCC 5710 / ATCC 11124 / CBS 356.35 / IMI 108563 / JCM 9778 / NBRC 8474) TaxID=1097556 RepID=R4XDE8_TAPDE|nr:protein of unknown function [Taphrina deformans PYCC 5710]|eukprot:CCG83631.1 protein of unknown function [Taphrina deformans PYCC 5710]
MSDSINKGSNSNDALSQDADRVDGKNAATGEASTMINDIAPDTGKPHSRDGQRVGGFNPNDAGGRGTGNEPEEGTPYTQTKPAEQASESHTLPGPSSIGKGQDSKGHNPTQ